MEASVGRNIDDAAMSLDPKMFYGVFTNKICAFDIGVHHKIKFGFVDLINLVIKGKSGRIHHNVKASELVKRVTDQVLTIPNNSNVAGHKIYMAVGVRQCVRKVLPRFVATLDIAATDHHAGSLP